MRREISNYLMGRRRRIGPADTLPKAHNLLVLLGKEEGHMTLRSGPKTLVDARYSLAAISNILEQWFNPSDGHIMAVHHEVYRSKKATRHYVDIREYTRPAHEFNEGKPYLLRYATIDFTVQ